MRNALIRLVALGVLFGGFWWGGERLYKEGTGQHRFIIPFSSMTSEFAHQFTFNHDARLASATLRFEGDKVVIEATVNDAKDKVSGVFVLSGSLGHGAIRNHFYLTGVTRNTDRLIASVQSGKTLDTLVSELVTAAQAPLEHITAASVSSEAAASNWHWLNKASVEDGHAVVEYSFVETTANAGIAIILAIIFVIYIGLWIAAPETMMWIHFFWAMSN